MIVTNDTTSSEYASSYQEQFSIITDDIIN